MHTRIVMTTISTPKAPQARITRCIASVWLKVEKSVPWNVVSSLMSLSPPNLSLCRPIDEPSATIAQRVGKIADIICKTGSLSAISTPAKITCGMSRNGKRPFALSSLGAKAEATSPSSKPLMAVRTSVMYVSRKNGKEDALV